MKGDLSALDPIVDYSVMLRMVAECRKVHGRKAAARLWIKLGLPDAPALDETSPDDVLGRFLAACVRARPGHRVKSSILYAAFDAWCKGAGERAMTQTAFGRAIKKRGIEWKLSHHVWFIDIELIAVA